ncbi:MAG: two-component system chemotaxis response regulator CheB [Pseudohongiellaceae bacterium]|jgi:two-component system chemotaxis response regulator CheB
MPITAWDDGGKVNGHKPSVDFLFQSAIECVGKNVVAVILTGMGSSGGCCEVRPRQASFPIKRIRSGLLKACE